MQPTHHHRAQAALLLARLFELHIRACNIAITAANAATIIEADLVMEPLRQRIRTLIAKGLASEAQEHQNRPAPPS